MSIPQTLFYFKKPIAVGKSFTIPNYIIICNDFINPNSLRTIRGTAICIKNNLNFLPVSLLALNVVHAVGIKIVLSGFLPLLALTFLSV